MMIPRVERHSVPLHVHPGGHTGGAPASGGGAAVGQIAGEGAWVLQEDSAARAASSATIRM
jgi:hypothetical protein